MPYVIETYKNRNNALALVNVDTSTTFEDKIEAQKVINDLLEEQTRDNEYLMNEYANRLEAQIMDLDTEDRILREPTLYNYIYKVAKYSKRQIKNMA